MLRIQNIKLPITYTHADLIRACEKALRRKNLPSVSLLRRSLDARKKDQIHYHISAAVTGYPEEEEQRILRQLHGNQVSVYSEKEYHFPYHSESAGDGHRPVIVGTGPAGYFAGLMLARAGYRPILLERGKPVEERKQDVDNFWQEGTLNPESNVSFGEGGAGTFSDGKLFTGNKDRDGTQAFVLKTFHQFGAPEEILYDAKPHIGTDVLYRIMQEMRREISTCGGEILFSHQLKGITPCSISGQDDCQSSGYKLTIKTLCKQGEESCDFRGDRGPGAEREIYTSSLVLAIGHSARDTFGMLHNLGLTMEQKPFAMGLRIEHPRELIDQGRYGADHKKLYPEGALPAADYKLTHHTSEGRAVFSFCMCPGGYVVNASTEEGGTVVNGMSYSGRDGENSNSALVVNVLPADYPGEHPLDGIAYQRSIEQKMYSLGGGAVPIQRYEDFRENRATQNTGTVTPMIKGKIHPSNLREGLPETISRAIIESMPSFDSEIPGFEYPDAILSGVESRTSSPVRILRNEQLQAPSFPGIFPCGEGAGYAGGIMSAAVDGIHVAEQVAAYMNKKG